MKPVAAVNKTVLAFPSLTGAQRHDADGWLGTGDFVSDGFQNPQHPSHCAIPSTDQDTKPRNIPERV